MAERCPNHHPVRAAFFSMLCDVTAIFRMWRVNMWALHGLLRNCCQSYHGVCGCPDREVLRG